MRLVILWFSGFAILTVLMIARTVGDIYGSKTGDAWTWFMPTILPTASLMIMVVATDFVKPDPGKETDKFLFRLAFWISLIYLLLVLFTVLNPVDSYGSSIAFMKMSNYWLAPTQGLTTAVLGAFFVKAK